MNRGTPKIDATGDWARFEGWSVLFDRVDGISPGQESRPLHTLSAELTRGLAELDDRTLKLLPSTTHHITVCDGVNTSRAQRSSRRDAEHLCRPDRLPPSTTALIDELVAAARPGLAFRARHVEVRGSALVLALDAIDRVAFQTLQILRSRVLDDLQELLDVSLVAPWEPHITLAYTIGAASAPDTETMATANSIVHGHDGAIRAAGASIYRFDSMVSYQRWAPAVGTPRADSNVRSITGAVTRSLRRGHIAAPTRRLMLDDLSGWARDLTRRPGIVDPSPEQLERTSSPPPFPIDAVYTWVDHADQDWQQSFHSTLAAMGAPDPASIHPSRFRDHNELMYSLRSLHSYANWFRKIWIVTRGDRPEWLSDSERVTVVPHAEILPADALPTFNSHAIESGIHRIDRLAEHFVYFNDDFFVSRPTPPETLFDVSTGAPKTFLSTDGIPPGPTEPGMYSAAHRTDDIVRRLTGERADRLLSHSPYAQLRSVGRHLEQLLPDEFERTAHNRFRDVDDISVPASLTPWYSVITDAATAATASTEYVSVGHATTGARLRRLRRERRVDWFCLNWTEQSSERWDDRVRTFLERRFPRPAPWEIAT